MKTYYYPRLDLRELCARWYIYKQLSARHPCRTARESNFETYPGGAEDVAYNPGTATYRHSSIKMQILIKHVTLYAHGRLPGSSPAHHPPTCYPVSKLLLIEIA